MSQSPIIENLNIQLGDIVELDAPSNSQLNKKIFYIKYLDKEKVILIDQDKNLITLTLNSEGELDDESIESINILNQAQSEGYARQNKLLPNTWIDIYFSGDLPLIITGNIINLENDMIEIKTYPDEEIIYIDFEYKGLPELLLIEKIVIRSSPQSKEVDLEGKLGTHIDPQAVTQFEAIEDSDLLSLEDVHVEPIEKNNFLTSRSNRNWRRFGRNNSNNRCS